MPIVDRRSPLNSNNARNADVASLLTSTIAPIVQQKMMSAFRVQGIQGVLLNRLTQGKPCSCKQHNNQVAKLSPDGKASPGAINRILMGSKEFGLKEYHSSPDEDFDEFHNDPTNPTDAVNQWLNTSNITGDDAWNSTDINTGPSVGDNGQYSPDLDDLFGDFDLSSLGLTDVSCPICFGSNYVGGYSMFRGQRIVLVPSDLTTTSNLDLLKFELSPGTHYATVTFPRGAVAVDAFRVMRNNKPALATFLVDGTSIGSSNILPFCDGRPHTLTITTESPMTHMEMQFALSKEPIYFEIPKLSKSQDVSLMEPTEPFQIIVSPDVPRLKAQDIILESQHGKVLVVGQVNPWNTRNRAMLGHEAQVRVAQPQELWNILSRRLPITGPKPTNLPELAKSQTISGFANPKSFSF